MIGRQNLRRTGTGSREGSLYRGEPRFQILLEATHIHPNGSRDRLVGIQYIQSGRYTIPVDARDPNRTIAVDPRGSIYLPGDMPTYPLPGGGGEIIHGWHPNS